MAELVKKFIRQQANPYFQKIVDQTIEREAYPTGEKLAKELEHLRNTEKPKHLLSWLKKMRAVGPKASWLNDGFWKWSAKEFTKPTSKHFLINGMILWGLSQYFFFVPGPKENFETSVNLYPHGVGPEFKNIKGSGVEHVAHTDIGHPGKFRM